MNSRRFTGLMPPVLSTERIAHLGTEEDPRAAAFQSTYVAVGVKLGLPPWSAHDRFRRVQTLVREGRLRRSSSPGCGRQACRLCLCPAAVALALGEAVELQHDGDVVRQQRDLDPAAQAAQRQHRKS